MSGHLHLGLSENHLYPQWWLSIVRKIRFSTAGFRSGLSDKPILALKIFEDLPYLVADRLAHLRGCPWYLQSLGWPRPGKRAWKGGPQMVQKKVGQVGWGKRLGPRPCPAMFFKTRRMPPSTATKRCVSSSLRLLTHHGAVLGQPERYSCCHPDGYGQKHTIHLAANGPSRPLLVAGSIEKH